MLSGLVECGECGRPFLACGGGRWRCKGNRSDDCANGSIASAMLEDRALAGLRDKLLAPERIERFARMLEEELIRAWREKHSERAAQDARLVAVQAAISKIVRQIESDGDVPRSLTKRLLELESEEEIIELQLADPAPEPFIRPPANYASMYRSAVENLGGKLSANDALAARTQLRKLITKVVVGGGDARGGKKRPMQLHGDIYDVLEFASVTAGGADKQKARRLRDGLVVTGMVAGTGFEPVTFRL
ncbi:zinc ribbon domain-containing protein [Polymorphobacter sp. PAMC 29334]|nr:zinc ribbon domain-containing protein [Polymorphobacter sp. PAMC 29334]